MSNALNDLTEIRTQFEQFENKMLLFAREASKKHGVAKTAAVLEQIAHTRDAMHKLAKMMANPVNNTPTGQWESEEEVAEYGFGE